MKMRQKTQKRFTGCSRIDEKYEMTRGSAYVYNEGDLHSPSRTSETRLIRFESQNMDNVERDAFVVAGS
jgi:hypothetical protein